MPVSPCDAFKVALTNQISSDPHETVRVEVEREVAHALAKGSANDVDHGLGIASRGVVEMDNVAHTCVEQVVMRRHGANVLVEIGLGAHRNARACSDPNIAVNARL